MKWSDIQVGQEFVLNKPPIEKVQLVKYAGASGDYNLIHTDVETARQVGLPGIIAHGMLSMGFMAQLMGQIAGDNGFVSRIKVRFKGMVFPGDAIVCKAQVTEKHEETKTVDFEIKAGKDPEQPTTIGNASITFTNLD